VAFVTTVNQIVDKLYPNGGCVKLSHIAYDGEDAKSDKDAGGQCQFSAMVSQLTQDKVKVENIPKKLGWAYSMSASPFVQVDSQLKESGTSSFVMPEMYWFMGANWPCMGSGQEYGQLNNLNENVPTCTSQIAYRDALEKAGLTPTQFYKWLVGIQPCMTGIVSGGPQGNFKAMRTNMVNYPGQVWPMFSSESLSNQDETAPPDSWCLARAFNAGGATQPKICGTADMLYSWSWDNIMELMDVTYRDMYLDAFGNYADDTKGNIVTNYTPYLAIYEAQFINPKWLDNQKFDSTLLSVCQGQCEDKLVQCTQTGTECADFMKKNPGICTNYTGYCNKSGTCHFDPPKPPPKPDPNQWCQLCTTDGKPVKCTDSECPDPTHCLSLSCDSPTCDDQGKVTCPSSEVDTGPYCGGICKSPNGCMCRYKNDASECPVCTKDTDCGTTKGNPIQCVPKEASQCNS
jgi:hypothetical protein